MTQPETLYQLSKMLEYARSNTLYTYRDRWPDEFPAAVMTFRGRQYYDPDTVLAFVNRKVSTGENNAGNTGSAGN